MNKLQRFRSGLLHLTSVLELPEPPPVLERWTGDALDLVSQFGVFPVLDDGCLAPAHVGPAGEMTQRGFVGERGCGWCAGLMVAETVVVVTRCGCRVAGAVEEDAACTISFIEWFRGLCSIEAENSDRAFVLFAWSMFPEPGPVVEVPRQHVACAWGPDKFRQVQVRSSAFLVPPPPCPLAGS